MEKKIIYDVLKTNTSTQNIGRQLTFPLGAIL